MFYVVVGKYHRNKIRDVGSEVRRFESQSVSQLDRRLQKPSRVGPHILPNLFSATRRSLFSKPSASSVPAEKKQKAYDEHLFESIISKI